MRRVRPKGSLTFRVPSRGVIDLASVRRHRRRGEQQTVFYVNGAGDWLNLLRSFPHFLTIDIHGLDILDANLILRRPDLILVDAELDWIEPVQIIREMDQLVGVPVVLLCDSDTNQKSPELIKRAFSAGLYDALYPPLSEEDLFESLGVLLKSQLHASD